MITQKKNKRLTSVHVNIETHNKFKHLCVESQLTFQTLVNKTLEKFVSDEKFRKQLLK